jgi:tryptophanyl-tRNA synthetase
MSLQDPLTKMSKSAPNPLSRILITDPPSEITRKIMAAVTDSSNFVSYDPISRPGVANLLRLLSNFSTSKQSAEELGKVHANLGLGQFKKLVAEAVIEGLAGVRGEFERVLGDEGYLDGVAERGKRRARESAEATMVDVREAMGL